MRNTRELAKKLRFGLPLAGIFILLAVFLPACKSSTDTNTDTDTTTYQARIVVSNTYGQTLEIFMDGTSQFTLTNGASNKIADVAIATHKMEARIPGGALIDTTEIDVTTQTDYSYTIDRPDINVVNGWGESLKVYLDDVYQFTLADDENRWLIAVPLASHFLKATRVSDGTEVASITINVTQNKDYTWTIS
jgi:hypothetical protein